MRRLIIRLVIALVTSAIGVGAVVSWTAFRSERAAAAEVSRATQELHGALKRNDEATLNRLLADDLRVTRVDNSTVNKTGLLSTLAGNDFVVEEFTAKDLRVKVEGDKASVTGEIKAVTRVPGMDKVEHRSRFVYSLEKRPAGWQFVSIRSIKL